MRRVRAAVIHISCCPSYGAARFAHPPAHRTTLFPPPPPRVQTDQEYRQQLRTTDRINGTAPAEVFQIWKNRVKFREICQNFPAFFDKIRKV